MIVKFFNNEIELTYRFDESYAPNVGDEVTFDGDSYNVISREFDLDNNEVLINLEVKQ